MNSYQQFIYLRTYSRWLAAQGRRETWKETVQRYTNFFNVPEAFQFIYNFEVMPSMRALWAAGYALERDNIAGYNCGYLPIDSIKAFAELLYILMNGTGVGFSVERQIITKLPEIASTFKNIDTTLVIADSKQGWAEGYYQYLKLLFEGYIPNVDFSQIRAEGERLKTFGGRASGPTPLIQLFKFTLVKFKEAQGRKLTSIECHDICCLIAECVVVGGVRRSACISLSNLSDTRMRHAKDGEFWHKYPFRSIANNSVVYTEKPSSVIFMEEWLSLMKSGSGERGIVNRSALQRSRGEKLLYGINPCGEVILRPREFCNLTEVIVRAGDTSAVLKKKVSIATKLGVLQSQLTKFNFIDAAWSKNCIEERLLGVSLTGVCDHAILGKVSEEAQDLLKTLKQIAQETAAFEAARLNINVPKAVTCIKPSGTVSQLTDASAGLHPRFAAYYIRRVRVNVNDPLAKMLIDQGIGAAPEVGQSLDNASTLVFSFPIKSPTSSILRNEKTALDQLAHWKMYKEYWCDHNPSSTIYIKEDEWFEVGNWVYTNFDMIGGLAFLPYAGGVYALAPYEEITEEEYYLLAAFTPTIDFTKLSLFETTDHTTGAQERGCSGNTCAYE